MRLVGRKPTTPTSIPLGQWTVSDLGGFFQEHRFDLQAFASGFLKDRIRAEEVVQESIIKVLLAAPELPSEAHAMNYVRKTIQNLCFDILRMEGRRPPLVLLDEADFSVKESFQSSPSPDEVMAAAEDSAIVRQALSLLSPAERNALVMWEIDGRSTEEIAEYLGVSASSVRHTIARARKSFRRILGEYVLDEQRGLTALDLLSRSYKRAVRVTKDVSGKALVLLVLTLAFFGVKNMAIYQKVSSTTGGKANENFDPEFLAPISSINDVKAEDRATSNTTIKKNTAKTINIKSVPEIFPGLDETGIPKSFTISDSSGHIGLLFSSARPLVISEEGWTSSQVLKTSSAAANILVTQVISMGDSGLLFEPVIAFGSEGKWVPLATKVTELKISRLTSGEYLLVAQIGVESAIESPIKVVASSGGRDLATAPKMLRIRALLNAEKTSVLGEAIYVIERGS